MNVLDETNTIVKEREDAYGSPAPHWEAVATCWTAYLKEAGLVTGDITGRRACEMMAILKCMRGAKQHKHDNHVDLAGYAWCANKCANGSSDA